jgi:hypothetical protein
MPLMVFARLSGRTITTTHSEGRRRSPMGPSFMFVRGCLLVQ